jgi:hypothetical protein
LYSVLGDNNALLKTDEALEFLKAG